MKKYELHWLWFVYSAGYYCTGGSVSTMPTDPTQAENVWVVSTAPREVLQPLNAPQGSIASWNDLASPQETAPKVWTVLSKIVLEQIILTSDFCEILVLLNYFVLNIATIYKSKLFYAQENVLLFPC